MIHTSYFGNVGNLLKYGFEKKDLVGISVYKCNWVKDIEYCKELMSKKSWLWDFKNGLMDWREYRYKYLNYLYSEVDMKFWWSFEEKFNGKVLLCFEKDYKFCHRSLIGVFYKWFFGKDVIKEW